MACILAPENACIVAPVDESYDYARNIRVTSLQDVEKKRIVDEVIAGKTDYAASNEDLEKRSAYDPD